MSTSRRTALLAAVVAALGLLVGIFLIPAGSSQEPAVPAAPAMQATTPPPGPSLPPTPAADQDVPPAAVVADRGAAVEPRFAPRDPEEWQGMLVREDERSTCTATELCGLAATCRSDGTCGACTADNECLGDEGCVLNHCVKRAQIACRSRRDCAQSGDRALCVLTGYSEDPRGNASMRSECLSQHGGKPQAPPPEPPPPGTPPPPPSTEQQLLDSVRQGT